MNSVAMRDHNLVECEIFSCLYYVYVWDMPFYFEIVLFAECCCIFVPNPYTVTQLMPEMNSVWEL